MKATKPIILGLVIAGLFVANHVWYHISRERINRQAAGGSAPVVQVDPSVSGHNSIQIDESSLSKNDFLYFATLESWAFDVRGLNSPPCPPIVRAVDGKTVKVMGFMYPLQQAKELKVFCLLRSTQTCCYGPRPQYNQYVFVEMAEPVKFERLAPVVVEGRFFVDPHPADGYIYRMEGSSVRKAAGDDQPISPEEFAKQVQLPLFDFASLEAVGSSQDRESEIPRRLSPVDGKPMVVGGYVVDRTRDSNDPHPWIMIGKYPWDGKATGTRPTLYNSVMVFVRDAGQLPPVWWQEAAFKGTMRLTKDPSQREKDGIVSLQGATSPVLGSGLLMDYGLLMPVWMECTIAVVYGVSVFSKFRSRRRR